MTAFKNGETPEIKAALAELVSRDPSLAKARDVAGILPDRRQKPNLQTLMKLIVGQQISVAAAAAIWARMLDGIKPFSAKRFLELDDESLRQMGLSRSKVAYCRNLAEAVRSRKLTIGRFPEMSNDEIVGQLVAIRGIGTWTAEVFLLFAMQRDDVFPADDLALQVAVQDLYSLEKRPSRRVVLQHAEGWRPHRGAAARLLWRYYGVTRKRQDPVTNG